MKKVIFGMAVSCALTAFAFSQAVSAQESAKPLPTLLIKGEVVSVDSGDPAATLLKVKDRYGFETPIYLTNETKIAEGDQASSIAALKAGVVVEVEYNFDINTAKRHAVNVVLSAPESAPSPEAAAVEETPVESTGASEEVGPPMVDEQAQAAPVVEEQVQQVPVSE